MLPVFRNQAAPRWRVGPLAGLNILVLRKEKIRVATGKKKYSTEVLPEEMTDACQQKLGGERLLY